MLELTRIIARTAVKNQHDTFFQVLLCLMIYISAQKIGNCWNFFQIAHNGRTRVVLTGTVAKSDNICRPLIV